MSILQPYRGPRGRAPIGVLPTLPSETVTPSLWETWTAALSTENIAGSFLDKAAWGVPIFQQPDPNFDPWNFIKGTKHESHFAAFRRANTKEDVLAIMAALEREEKYRETLERSGFAGIASVLMAGALLDPTNLIPIGGTFKAVSKIARIGHRLPVSMLMGAAAGAGGNALQEAALQRTQFTRTDAESRMAIDAGIFLGGILGSAGGMLPHLKEATAKLFYDFEGNPSFGMKREYLWAMRNHPDYKYTRMQFRQDLVEDWGLKPVEADAAMSWFEATFVRQWAEREGKAIEDFYPEHVDQIITFHDQVLGQGRGETEGKPFAQFATIRKQPARQPYPWAFMQQNWDDKVIVQGIGEPAGRDGGEIAPLFLGEKKMVDFSGAMAMVPNGKAIIAGLRGAADLGTLLHEMAHLQRRIMTPQEMNAWEHYYYKVLGLSKREAEEAWVRDVEALFKDSEFGKNLPKEVEQAALSFRDMLVRVWGGLKDSEVARSVAPYIQQMLNKYWKVEEEKKPAVVRPADVVKQATAKKQDTFAKWLAGKLGTGKNKRAIYAGRKTALGDLIGGDTVKDKYGVKKVSGINKLVRNYPHAVYLFTDVRKGRELDFEDLVADLRNEYPGLLPEDEGKAYQTVFNWLIQKDKDTIRLDGGGLVDEVNAKIPDEMERDLEMFAPEVYQRYQDSGLKFVDFLDSLDETEGNALWETIHARYDQQYKDALVDDVNARVQERWGERGIQTLEQLEEYLESQGYDEERIGIILADYFEPGLGQAEEIIRDADGNVLFQKLDVEKFARQKLKELMDPERTELGVEPVPWLPQIAMKFLTKLGPGSRLFTSRYSEKGAQLAEKLLHLSFYLGKHWEGRTGDVPPVEIRVFKKVNQYNSEGKKALVDGFAQYRARVAGQQVPDEATLSAILKYKIGDYFSQAIGRKQDVLDYEQYKRLVYEAWGGADTGIPEVQKAGAAVRDVMTRVCKELIEAGLLNEEMTKEGHRPRQYLPMAIERYGSDFRKILQQQISLGMVADGVKDLSTLVNDITSTYTGHLWYEVTPEKELEDVLRRRKQLRLERDALVGADDYRLDKKKQARVKKIQEDLVRIDEEKSKFLRHRGLLFDDSVLLNVDITHADGTTSKVDFIETDPERIFESYLKTVIPDLELKRQFGSIDLLDQLEEVLEDYEAKITEASGDTRALEKEKRDVLRDLVIVRDRIRGTDNRPADPRDPFRRMTNALVKLNSTIYLGNVVLASFADPARVVMRYGFQPFAKHLRALTQNKALWKEFSGWERTIGAGTDVVSAMSQRYLELADSREHLRGDSWVERKIDKLFDNFGLVSGLEPWTSFGKRFTGLVSSHFILERARVMAKAVKEGKATLQTDGTAKGTVAVSRKDIQQLAQMGLDARSLVAIAEQFERHGDLENPDLWLPRTERWENLAVRERFESAIIQEMNNVIITPTIGDRPRAASTPWGSVIFQFKSFGMAAQQKMILAGLQQRDQKILSGLLASIFFGALGYTAKQVVRGKDVEGDPDALLMEAIDNSGVLGLFADLNGIMEVVSRGRLGLHPMVSDGTMARFTGRDVVDVLVGPSGSTIKNFGNVLGGAITFDVTDQTLYSLQKITPYSQLWYIRRLSDLLREAASEAVME